MARLSPHTSSDYDGRAHSGAIRIDLQDIALPDASLDVPLPQALTVAVAPGVEFHDDDTPVHWRFGWDLGKKVRATGLDVVPLVTADLIRRLDENDSWGYVGPDADSESLLAVAGLMRDELVPVVSDPDAQVRWLQPSFCFVVRECRRCE